MNARRRPGSRAIPRHPAVVWGRRLVIVILLAWASAEWIGFVRGLMILTAVGFIAAIAGIRHPVLGLLGVGLLVVLDPITRHMVLNASGLLRWNSFNYWLIIVTLIYLPRAMRLSDPHSQLLRLLIALLSVELLLAPRWEPGLQNLLNISTVFAIVIYFQRTPCDATTIFWLGLVMSLTAAAGGVESYRHAEMLPVMNKNAFAMFPLTGLLGACLAMPFAAAVRGGQILLAPIAAVNLAWVFLTGSRGSFLLALLGMAYLLISVRTLPRRLTSVTAVVLVLVGASQHFEALQAGAARRFTKLLDEHRSLEDRTSGRANLILGGWRIFLAHPMGIGTGGFEDAWAGLDQVDNSTRFAQGKLVPAHSGWIMVLAENGVPGIILFAMFVTSFAVVGLKRRDPTLVRMGIFTTVILGTAFCTTEFSSKALWLTAGAAMALMHQQPGAARRRVVLTVRRLRPLVQPVHADA